MATSSVRQAASLWPLLLTGGALLSIAVFNRRAIARMLFRAPKKLAVEDVRAIMTDLMDAFFPVLFESGQTSTRAMILASRAERTRKKAVDAEAVAAVLMDGGVGATLERLQGEVLGRFDVTEEEFSCGSAEFAASDPEIARLSEALDTMVNMFISGDLPVHGNAKLLSQPTTETLLAECMRRKQARIALAVQQMDVQSSLPSPADVETLSREAAAVEEAVCREEDISTVDLCSSIAHYTNTSDSFRSTLVELLFKFQSLPSS